MPEYNLDDVSVFVDGVEIVGLADDTGITPKDDKDNIKPIKDWSGRTRAWARLNGTDCEGSICVLGNSESVSYLLQLASSKKPVQVVFTSKNPEATGWSKISADECRFFFPEVKPDKEKNVLKFDFVGTNFQIE